MHNTDPLRLKLRRIGSNSSGFILPNYFVRTREYIVGKEYQIIILELE